MLLVCIVTFAPYPTQQATLLFYHRLTALLLLLIPLILTFISGFKGGQGGT